MSRRRFDSGRVAGHWDAEGTWQPDRGLYWLELAAVQCRLSQKVSGQSDALLDCGDLNSDFAYIVAAQCAP